MGIHIITSAWCFGPISLSLCLVNPAKAQVDQQRAEAYFKEAATICQRDAGRLWGVSLCHLGVEPEMRPFIVAMLLLIPRTSVHAQPARSPVFDMVIAVGTARAGSYQPCESNQYGFIGAHPRFGKALYAVAILEKWGELAGDPCAYVVSPGANPTQSTLHAKPTSRIGLGAGLDLPVEEIHLTSRLAAGRMSNAAPWYSAAVGFRYSRFFLLGELGGERETRTVADRSERDWVKLAGVTFGLIL